MLNDCRFGRSRNWYIASLWIMNYDRTRYIYSLNQVFIRSEYNIKSNPFSRTMCSSSILFRIKLLSIYKFSTSIIRILHSNQVPKALDLFFSVRIPYKLQYTQPHGIDNFTKSIQVKHIKSTFRIDIFIPSSKSSFRTSILSHIRFNRCKSLLCHINIGLSMQFRSSTFLQVFVIVIQFP